MPQNTNIGINQGTKIDKVESIQNISVGEGGAMSIGSPSQPVTINVTNHFHLPSGMSLKDVAALVKSETEESGQKLIIEDESKSTLKITNESESDK